MRRIRTASRSASGVLYRATITIPSQVPVGTYTAETFLIDRGKVHRRGDPRHPDRQSRASSATSRLPRGATRFLYGLTAVFMSLGARLGRRGRASAAASSSPKPILTASR